MICAVDSALGSSSELDSDASIPETAPFVGRQSEMSALARVWRRVEAGERHTLLIQGEPGIGKSRLVGEFAARLRERQATVLTGHCHEDVLVPYQPFVELLQRYLPACPAGVLDSQPPGLSGSILRLVPELKDRLPAWPEPAKDDAEFERFRLFEAVSSLLTAGVARPTDGHRPRRSALGRRTQSANAESPGALSRGCTDVDPRNLP